MTCWRRWRVAVSIPAVVLAGLMVAAGCTSNESASGPDAEVGAESTTAGALTVEALSTRREYVTGGDVLVGVEGVPRGETPVLSVDGAERAGALAAVEGDGWRGLVDDLPVGRSTITVSAGGRSTELEVVSHPTSGPLFSGPPQEPFRCTTVRNGLAPAVDDDCTAPTQIRWDYVDGAGTVRPLEDRGVLPPDVATTEIGGRTVPMVVRTESGTINRGVYWISVLDATPSGETWDGVSDGWNGDLLYRYGGGCGTSFSQGVPLVGADNQRPTLDVELLRRGYAVATNTLNTFQVHCNDVLSAETTLMVKEHFSEEYGRPAHTIGEGGSGGAIQQFLIAQNYPGLLDGAVIGAPFPDAMSMAPGVTDCGLLEAYYATDTGRVLGADQRRAVNGHATAGTCGTWKGSFLATIDPTIGCDLPPEAVYDPVTNRGGARCTLQDSSVNLFGEDPATGFARRPLDNVGVMYGLQALQDEVIDPEQFVALNEGMGGYDIDGRIVPERMVAIEDEIAHLGGTGRVLVGGGDSTRIPIVAVNTYSDPTGDIHDRWRVFSIRERLDDAAGGTATGLTLWTAPGGSIVGSLGGGSTATRDRALDAVAEWLVALDEAGSAVDDRDRLDALADARPASAEDRCTTPAGVELTGEGIYEADNECTQAYPVAGDPRRAAGQDLRATTAKCALMPLAEADLPDGFTAGQLERLRAVFPDGICDWSEPGVGEVGLREAAGLETWISYGP
jgi:hypothetical protein